MNSPDRIHVIDSHTGGEPTRLVVSGGPPLGNGSLPTRLDTFRSRFDHFRSAIAEEPRGSEAIVGALLCEPTDPSCVAGVIFFNNVGYLGMCGHGTIGLAVTLAYLGRLEIGRHRIETPVGVVDVELHSKSEASVYNVASYRAASGVSVEVKGAGRVTGDVAWGGNWFFLTSDCSIPLSLNNLRELTDYAWELRHALKQSKITGAEGSEIDHIEIYGPPSSSSADSKNFVLCPGGSYDRSPCGTGTSAKLACLYADGALSEGQLWRQESLIGSIFEGSFQVKNESVYPKIRGSAFVVSEGDLLLQPEDSFCWGIQSDQTLA